MAPIWPTSSADTKWLLPHQYRVNWNISPGAMVDNQAQDAFPGIGANGK